MNTRLLGTILLVGSLIVMLNGFRSTALGLDDPFSDVLGSAAYVIWGIGGICGILGLIQLNALGSNAVARALGFLPLLGFAAFVVGDGLRVIGFMGTEEPLYQALAAVAWIAMMAGMLVVGILTIAAKTWSGWRRFVPLFVIVMMPVALGIGGAVNNTGLAAVIGFAAWMLLGYIIATTEPGPALQESITV